MGDEVRLLGKTGGYTDKPSSALGDGGVPEPEAVDRETQRRITLDAARAWPHLDVLHAADRSSKPLARRIANAKAQAKLTKTDIHKPLRLVELALSSGRSHAHVERRVEALEQVAFPPHSVTTSDRRV